MNEWVCRIHKERGYNKAAVAVANKNARHIWAMLAYGDKYVDHLKVCTSKTISPKRLCI
ncbi:hypothetical protein [Legionella yabuuchiae]|uniref:hypothetical protein n=1 Tax=Legionella yabuuchiae TaxID=376727 RepID=UPI0013EFA927|nr:hypothetical protein [Legionella yabuuchiae]